MEDESTTPIPVFKELLVFNQPFKTDSSLSVKKHVQFDYSQSDFTISYTGLYFRRANEVTYSYQLVGQDKKWINAGKDQRVRYTNLSPGTYQFKLKAANFDGVWSEPHSFWITVSPPFWLKPWFLLLCLIALGFVIAGLVRILSTRKYKKLLVELEKTELINNERTRIAQDLHDEIGANLTQIALLSEVVQREITSTGSNSAPLKRVAEAAKNGVVNLSEIVWAINPKNDKLENVVSYIQEYAENYFKESDIRVLFDISDSFPNVSIASDTRHALIMTIKEILNNALKYSEASTMWVHLHFEENRFIIQIQENGKGFELADEASKGNGIGHILHRLNSFGGVITIDSAIGHGCETKIVLPIT